MNTYLPNLAFEDELLHPERSFARGTLAAIADLAPLMGLMASADDQIVIDAESTPEQLPSCLQHAQFVSESDIESNATGGQLIPWGWTRRAIVCANQNHQREYPPLNAVHQVNSRQFLASFDKVVRLHEPAQPGDETFGHYCESIEQFERVVSTLLNAGNSRLVVKPQISHAGRNRIFLSDQPMNDQQNGWLKKRIDDGVYVEPWVSRTREWSIQFDIPHPGSASPAPKCIGTTQLLNDPEGRYAGNIICADQPAAHTHLISQHAELICLAAQAHGYWGPVGLDGFQFRDSDGNEGLRLCNDINARFTMGRLALQLVECVPAGEYGAWCQFAQRIIGANRAESGDPEEKGAKILAAHSINNVSVIRTSPQFVGGKPVRTTTLLLTGPSIAELIQARQILHGNL